MSGETNSPSTTSTLGYVPFSIRNRTELKNGEVALVGAGPGDVELLTIKALHFLQQAEVVLFDYLVSDDIMAQVNSNATTICVGKRSGFHLVKQHETNQMLVDFAQQGLKVVRVKGGDPFLFGRGAEELEALVDANVPFHVVPGITAATGATAYAGIPLTHRDYAQSAVFVTGHLKCDSNPFDWSTLVSKNQTLVIYMGLSNALYIQQQLIENGREPHIPVAVIERGTQTKQSVRVGELQQLHTLAQQVKAPALIVIGEVVALAKKLHWFSSLTPATTKTQFSATSSNVKPVINSQEVAPCWQPDERIVSGY